MRRALLAVPLRTSLLAALAALALVPPGAHAATSPQVTDQRADWPLPSQDLVSGRLSSVLVRGKPHLRGEIRLAEPPAPGVPTQYQLTFRVGCTGYALAYDWSGADGVAGPAGSRFYTPSRCESAKSYSHPVTVTVRGTTITLTVPYGGGIRRGQTAHRFTLEACISTGCDGGVYADDRAVTVVTGDTADGRHNVYVVGSDLPRR